MAENAFFAKWNAIFTDIINSLLLLLLLSFLGNAQFLYVYLTSATFHWNGDFTVIVIVS